MHSSRIETYFCTHLTCDYQSYICSICLTGNFTRYILIFIRIYCSLNIFLRDHSSLLLCCDNSDPQIHLFHKT